MRELNKHLLYAKRIMFDLRKLSDSEFTIEQARDEFISCYGALWRLISAVTLRNRKEKQMLIELSRLTEFQERRAHYSKCPEADAAFDAHMSALKVVLKYIDEA